MKYMHLSVEIAKKTSSATLKVGAVLVSTDYKLICTAYNVNDDKSSWWRILLDEAKKKGLRNQVFLFVTVNTYDNDLDEFGINVVARALPIIKTFVGLPDPDIENYLENDPVLLEDSLERYPDEIQREILALNYSHYASGSQMITNCPYYHDNRISKFVQDKLSSYGYLISKDELNNHKNRTSLINFICEKYTIDYTDAVRMVNSILSEAFNKKYGSYAYTNDTRSLTPNWKQIFSTIFYNTVKQSVEECAIVDVGVGAGHEALDLFSGCHQITYVDVAMDGLINIKNNNPFADIVNASADDLKEIERKQFDVYVSLRTYNSSFFDIAKAVSEAKRVLKDNACIIVSVANGFLCAEKNCIIPGLLIPGTEFVDIYRGLDTTRIIKKEYVAAGFTDIQLCPTSTEIYLSAIAA